jgi:hypothetical protein
MEGVVGLAMGPEDAGDSGASDPREHRLRPKLRSCRNFAASFPICSTDKIIKDCTLQQRMLCFI